MPNKISVENKKFFDEIVEKLLAGHAAVMIGSGFSKNAVSNCNSNTNFPDWSELGDAFYDKLYGSEQEQGKKYLNILKLAGEVEATFGRPVLDGILKKHIPDSSYEPSELHKKLVDLPWTDVFTTNYDTLLERAAKYNFQRKYSIIYSKNDLVCASKPRIIKLHGSFPSHRPFIITEEDYRLYPQNNAPFVNTVQQSLLENTLCLIGFSGDDPNFLAWIGWLRDNMNTHFTKIYLVCFSELPISQKQLLHDRNIIPINLNNNNYSEALDSFISYLSDEVKSKDIKLWPGNQKHQSPEISPNKVITDNYLLEVIDFWKEQRESYLGWEILPIEKRTRFWKDTKSYLFIVNQIKNFDISLQIQFVYELVWRLDKSLMPINEKIKPVIEQLLLEKNIDPNIKNILDFALLRYYRQKGQDDRWREIYQYISNCNLPLDLRSELEYEKGLHCLFGLYFPELKETVESWEYPSGTPFQNAKKAGILAETGQLDMALKILEESLVQIRIQEVSSKSQPDYKLLSQESFILHLYYYVKFIHDSTIRRDNLKNPIDRQGIKERASYLAAHLCDSDKECEHFKYLFSQKCAKFPIEQKYDFNLNPLSSTTIFRYNIEAESAYSFFIFCEKIGFPFNIHFPNLTSNLFVQEALEASKHIVYENFFWTVSVICRIANEKSVNAIFDRQSLLNFSTEEASNLSSMFIKILLENKELLSVSVKHGANNLADTLALILPEILSRLCIKCNTATKHKIIDLIAVILSSPNQQKYPKILELLNKLASSLSEKEVQEILPKIIELKVPDLSILPQRGSGILSPIYYLKVKKDYSKMGVKTDNNLLVSYFREAESTIPQIRKWSISTLIELFHLNLLSERNQKLLAKAIWAQCDQNNLPNNVDYLKAVFLKLPQTTNINSLDSMNKYLNNVAEFIESYTTSYDYVEVTNYCNDLNLISSYETGLVDMDKHVLVLINFWDKFKQNLKRKPIFAFENFSDLTHFILSTITNIVKKYELSKKNIRQTIKFVESLNENGISALKLRSSLTKEIKSDIIYEIQENISNKERLVRMDALMSIIILTKKFLSKDTKSLTSNLIYSIRFEESDLLADNIWTLAVLIKQNNNTYFDEEEPILSAIKHVAEISEYNTDSMLRTEEKIIIRQQAMLLASVIFHLYPDKDKVPAEILYFFEIYQDENEFADVRNMWERYEMEIQ